MPSTGCSSILNSNAKSPRSPQSGFPVTTEVEVVDSVGSCAPALPGSAHTRQAAPTTMLTMPAIPRRRRLTSSPMGLCSPCPGASLPRYSAPPWPDLRAHSPDDAPQAHPSSSARCWIMPPLGHHSKQLRGGLTLASATHHAPPPNRFGSAQHELTVDGVDRDGVPSAISPSRAFIASLSAS